VAACLEMIIKNVDISGAVIFCR